MGFIIWVTLGYIGSWLIFFIITNREDEIKLSTPFTCLFWAVILGPVALVFGIGFGLQVLFENVDFSKLNITLYKFKR